jgi:protein TonB
MNTNRTRLIIFIFVGALHAFLIFFLVFKLNTIVQNEEPRAKVMKLADIQEDTPPPPPPPKPKIASPQNTVAAVAENMVAADEVPDDQTTGELEPVVYETAPAIDYLPQHKISVVPKVPDDQIRRNIEYPAIALRSGIEGTVILELFIDSKGEIRRINVLKEEPAGRGFGESAVNAFRGITAVPAEANGTAVAVHYRYPVRFKISE